MKATPYAGSDGIMIGHMILCPACKERHQFPADRWRFNGDTERPTFSPSMMIRSGHYASAHKPGDHCWCDYWCEHPDEKPVFTCGVCHSIVTDGRIMFCGDCTHTMAGQTVDLPDFPEAG